MFKKKTKASAEYDIEDVKSAIEAIRSILPGCSDLTKHELEEQMELLQKVVDGETLTKYLEPKQLKPVESITFEDKTELRITEDMRYILRYHNLSTIVQLKDLHAKGEVYGQLSGDTIVMLEHHYPDESPSNGPIFIRPWRVELAPSIINTKDMKDEKDFKDLSKLIKKILTNHEFPKDVNHLLSKLDGKDPSIDEMFLANHPCTWTSNEVYLYLERMIYKFKTSEDKIQTTIKTKAKRVSVPKDWFGQLKKAEFKEVYDTAAKENKNFQYYPPALQILFFMLYLFNHGFPTESERQNKVSSVRTTLLNVAESASTSKPKKIELNLPLVLPGDAAESLVLGTPTREEIKYMNPSYPGHKETGEKGRWIRKVEGELFCLFPCFLSNFVEQVFYMEVIQAAIGGGDK